MEEAAGKGIQDVCDGASQVCTSKLVASVHESLFVHGGKMYERADFSGFIESEQPVDVIQPKTSVKAMEEAAGNGMRVARALQRYTM